MLKVFFLSVLEICKHALCLASSKQFPVLNTDVQEVTRNQEKQSWWEKALYSPLFPSSECEGKKTVCH